MKIAISIPDAIGEKADRLARQMKMSRSAVFAMAIEQLPIAVPEPSLTDQINAALDEMTSGDWAEQRMTMRAGQCTALKGTEWN